MSITEKQEEVAREKIDSDSDSDPDDDIVDDNEGDDVLLGSSHHPLLTRMSLSFTFSSKQRPIRLTWHQHLKT